MPAPKPAAGTTPSRADPRPLRQGAPGAERGEAWDARAEVRRVSREDAAEFAALEAAWVDELASVGPLQIVLNAARCSRGLAARPRRPVGRRNGVGAPSPDGKGFGPHSPTSPATPPGGQQTELLAERWSDNAGMGVIPILDANEVGALEALLRYRGAAVAEFWWGLRTLKAFQAEQALPMDASAAGPTLAPRVPPIEPSASSIRAPEPPVAGYALQRPPRATPPRTERTREGRGVWSAMLWRRHQPRLARPVRPAQDCRACAAPRTERTRRPAEREHAHKRQPEYVLGQRKAPGWALHARATLAAERTRQRSAAAVAAPPDQTRPGHSIPLPCRAARRQRNDLLTGPSKARRGFRGSHGPAKEMANQGEGTINSLATLGPVRIRGGTAPPRAPKDSTRRRGLALTPPPGAPTSPRSRGRAT